MLERKEIAVPAPLEACRITKDLCHKVAYIASARGWLERSPRSQVMWKTTRSTSQFGCITKVLSQKPAESKHVGWRTDTVLPGRARGLES